jgi:hypothetical protein
VEGGQREDREGKSRGGEGIGKTGMGERRGERGMKEGAKAKGKTPLVEFLSMLLVTYNSICLVYKC